MVPKYLSIEESKMNTKDTPKIKLIETSIVDGKKVQRLWLEDGRVIINVTNPITGEESCIS